MTPDELRAIMDFLVERVRLADDKAGEEIAIAFDAPTVDEMVRAGLNSEGSGQILAAPWWAEMVEDIVETPEMCEPDDTPDQVLQYARDVVPEYIRKRASL
jgi:hypothetical protein